MLNAGVDCNQSSPEHFFLNREMQFGEIITGGLQQWLPVLTIQSMVAAKSDPWRVRV
jgi:hypothetical protein